MTHEQAHMVDQVGRLGALYSERIKQLINLAEQGNAPEVARELRTLQHSLGNDWTWVQGLLLGYQLPDRVPAGGLSHE